MAPHGWTLVDGEVWDERLTTAHSPTKGHHVVAARPIPKGTTIVVARGFACEAHVDTLVLVRELVVGRQGWGEDERALFARLERLCPASLADCPPVADKFRDDREQLEQLKRDVPDAPDVDQLMLLEAKIDLNSLSPGLFPLASVFNHACRANTVGVRTSQPTLHALVTLSDVAEGDELVLNYLEESFWYLPTDQRQWMLSRRWHFDCACERCSGRFPNERLLEALLCPQPDCSGVCVAVEGNDELALCSTCGKTVATGQYDSVQHEVYGEIQAAMGGESTQEQFDLYSAALRKCVTCLAPSHWMRHMVVRRLGECAHELALEARHERNNDDLVLKFAQLHKDCTQQQLDNAVRVYPEHDYHLSVLHDKLAYVSGVLAGDGAHCHQAAAHIAEVKRIRDVCGWMVDHEM